MLTRLLRRSPLPSVLLKASPFKPSLAMPKSTRLVSTAVVTSTCRDAELTRLVSAVATCQDAELSFNDGSRLCANTHDAPQPSRLDQR